MKKKFLILSNFEKLDEILKNNPTVEHSYVGTNESFAKCWKIAWRAILHGDALIFNIDHKRLLVVCAVFSIFAPRRFRHCKLISVDILLRPTFSLRAKLLAKVKKLLLSQVNSFILYFKNWDGYVREFGLPRDRLVYVPFKVNSWEKLNERRTQIGEGEYVLLAGATLRDYGTFVEALRRTKIPAVLLLPGIMESQLFKLAWYSKGIPENLKLEFHNDGKESTFLSYFENAKILCLPRFQQDIASTGISSLFCAMALGKCVLISSGPGAEDILEEAKAAAFFEPENPQSLADQMQRLWRNDAERRQTALNGVRFVSELKGEERLLTDILTIVGVGLVQQ